VGSAKVDIADMIPEFWSLTFANWKHIFFHWYFALAIILGVAPALLVGDTNLQERYSLILRTEATVAVTVLGVVLAGLALVVTLMNEDLLALADRVGRGVIEDYFPFSLAAVVAVTTTCVALMFLIMTPRDEVIAMRIGVGLSTGLFVWTLFNILALVRFVAQRGITRALYASVSAAQTSQTPPAQSESPSLRTSETDAETHDVDD
jgi:hypothetical protein